MLNGSCAAALIVADFVCKDVVGERLAVLGNYAESETGMVEARILLEPGPPGNAASGSRVLADDEDDQVRAVSIAQAMDLVHVTERVVAAAVAGSERQASEVRLHVGGLGIAHLMLLYESQTQFDT